MPTSTCDAPDAATSHAPRARPRLSVVIPAYREQERIADTVRAVRAACAPAGDVEIVVVDDGSPDATAQAAAPVADRVVRLAVNRGKGAAVRAGVAAASGRTISFTDADLAYAPDQLLGLLAAVEAGAPVVIGSRRVEGSATLARTTVARRAASAVFAAVGRAALDGRYPDTQCGIKAFRADVAGALFDRAAVDRFAFDVELLAVAEVLGLPIAQHPVSVRNCATSTVHLGRDSLRMLADIAGVALRRRLGRYGAGGRPATGPAAARDLVLAA
jgi:glycosyltransferase involved in cell wall biosynthesis